MPEKSLYKTEKLATAVYVITGFFTDNEPVKWRLRTLATRLAPLGELIADESFADSQTARLEARNLVSEMRTLLKVANIAGLVSGANYDLLNQEFVRYISSLGVESKMAEVMALKSEDRMPLQPRLATPVIKDRIVDEPMQKAEKVESVRPAPRPIQVSDKKTRRRNVILDLAKRKKEIMIKDVSPHITSCSEKTIQRELLAMVKAGILKKEGEKRWSKYSLSDSQTGLA